MTDVTRTDYMLDLGCGENPIPGFLGVDRKLGTEAYPLGFPDNSASVIRASHILEHFPAALVADVLKDWVRVLKPGGILKVAVPDFRWIARQYLDDQQFPLIGFLYGSQSDDNDYHKSAFDEEGLREALSILGLVDIERWESEVEDCAALPVSLNLQGRKPGEGEVQTEDAESIPEVELPTEILPDGVSVEEYMSHPDRRFAHYTIQTGDVVAVMTAPRLGFTETANCAFRAFSRLNLPFKIEYGVFWTQSLERAIHREQLGGAKYILTLDYDTAFDWRDVQTLYGIMENRPDIGALAPIQMGRDMAVPLIGMRDPSTDGAVSQVAWEKLQQDTLTVGTAHFGLTMIRTSCLESLPHPWFHETPSPETGLWDKNRTDADVQFWLDFVKAGNQLCVANRVAVGHIEMVVTWPDRFLRPAVQSIGEYHALGRPGRESNLWK